ncbi:hypothetical protein ElP_73430 (plasmid) [Tautonia plasticadhaerens]|uniref:Uncharacterized protein n=1 Tax=Tautonia plasticadhaerens TaxID=2527974 RepID=A0A518HEU6_9BACT|nr:hypothetical protein ElP_73430 [Tautonia plasticadhaerens]
MSAGGVPVTSVATESRGRPTDSRDTYILSCYLISA